MRSIQPLAAAEVRATVCPWCGQTPRRATAGVAIRRDAGILGVIGYAPARDDLGHCPPGAALITTWWVHPDEVGEHVGTQLFQRMAGQLRAAGVRCVIAAGTRGVPTCNRLPASWLEHMGFIEHVVDRQWRFDLRRTVPVLDWLSDAAAVVHEQLRVWRPRPESATRAAGVSRIRPTRRRGPWPRP